MEESSRRVDEHAALANSKILEQSLEQKLA